MAQRLEERYLVGDSRTYDDGNANVRFVGLRIFTFPKRDWTNMLAIIARLRVTPRVHASSTALILLAAALATSACASVPDSAGVPPDQTSATASPIADPNVDKILETIASAASDAGDSQPSNIQWVYAQRGQIAGLLNFGIPEDEDHYAQVLITARGKFVARSAPRPPGRPAPTGTVIQLVLDTTTWQSTDFGLVNDELDLATIGTVYTGTK
jgi:hypothetical protein